MTTLIPTEYRVRLLTGQALEIEIPVAEPDGTPVPLDDATVEFLLADTVAGPTVATVPTGKVGNVITASLTTAQSLSLGTRSLVFSCWVTILGQATPVALGRLDLMKYIYPQE